MAHLHNLPRNTKPSFFSGLGQKVETAVKIGAGIKSAYDIGKSIYTAGAAVAPYITPLLLA